MPRLALIVWLAGQSKGRRLTAAIFASTWVRILRIWIDRKEAAKKPLPGYFPVRPSGSLF